MSDTVSSASLWLRACSLVVADMQGNGIELAGPTAPQILRIKFTVEQYVNHTPASMHARVYNLSPTTVSQIKSLATQNSATISGLPNKVSAQVVLKAGYQQNFGQLFLGQIYQLRVGKESNVDSYIDIFAADGDASHNWATMQKSLSKGYSSTDVLQQCANSMQPWQTTYAGPPDGLQSQPSPRGKVMFGMTRDYLDDLGDSNNFTWNIQDNQLQPLPKFAVKPGEAVVINSRTGQIGVPEQTENGIRVMCLLNPAIGWGSQIRLNNTEIAQFVINSSNTGSLNTAVSPNVAYAKQAGWVPPLNTDGNYVVVYSRHTGDTRSEEWFTEMTALSIDPSAPIPQAIAAQGDIPPPLSSSAIKGPTQGVTPP